MSLSISMVLLDVDGALPVAEIERGLRDRNPELEAATIANEGSTASIKLKDAELTLGAMPAPVPWSDLEGPCSTSLLWKDAAEHVKPHRAHVIVTVLSQLSPVEEAIVLTKCTAAVLAACRTSIGVYWGNATLVIPKAIFLEFAEKVLPLGPPLDIWVDFRVGWETNTTSGGFTQGMEELGHMEMEARAAPEKPSELRERLQNIARYLLENGAVIRDGDTVGESEHEKIRVIHAQSTFGHSGKVMRLEYEAGRGRSWWKLW